MQPVTFDSPSFSICRISVDVKPIRRNDTVLWWPTNRPLWAPSGHQFMVRLKHLRDRCEPHYDRIQSSGLFERTFPVKFEDRPLKCDVLIVKYFTTGSNKRFFRRPRPVLFIARDKDWMHKKKNYIEWLTLKLSPFLKLLQRHNTLRQNIPAEHLSSSFYSFCPQSNYHVKWTELTFCK